MVNSGTHFMERNSHYELGMCVCLCTLVYVCLSIVEGLPGAVQVPMCMAMCAHVCVCPQACACLFGMHLVSVCACICTHVSTLVCAHRGELKERENSG